MNGDESIEDSQSVKRVYRPCGSTPNKPLGKKPRNFRGEGSTSRKGLHFSPKPSRRQLTFNPKGKRRPWTKAETAALVQYVALHKDQQATEKEWPSMQHTNNYRTNAATFVQDAVDTSYLRQALSVRQRVQNHISKQFKTISEAEDAFGLDVDMYIEGTSKDLQEMEPIHPPQNVMEALDHLHESQLLQVLHSLVVSNKLCPKKVVEKIAGMLKTIRGTNMHVILLDLELTVCKEIANKLFLNLAEEMGLDTNPADFVTLSLTAMRELQLKKKNNLVYKFCECIGKTRPGNSEPLMALNRMPFGLIEYNIEFFTCTNVHQIQEPSDYKLWLQTMDTEFPSRFKRLFAGPMWSGCESKDVGYPLKTKVNIARTSLKTQWERGKQSSENKVVSSAIQVENLKMMKQSNPDGRYWIKLDATDVKSGLMESIKCVWNGDVDLGDGKLQQKRAEYERRFTLVDGFGSRNATHESIEQGLRQLVDDLTDDKEFLKVGLQGSTEVFRTYFQKPGTSEDKLKSLNWDIVEFQTLLQQAQQIKQEYEELLSHLSPNQHQDIKILKVCLSYLKPGMLSYLRNLFKKKRDCATHVLVTMLYDERRNKKPYALPVRHIPYHAIKDQYVRDMNKELKQEMVNHGLKLAGTVTDGEFCSLRTQGETRPLHLWQIIHDARESVRSTSKKVLVRVGHDAITPEVDPVTGETRLDRGDHNHVFRRAASSIRKGDNPELNYDAFDDALLDPKSGLTHAVLVGKRKQSNVDAERLLSSLVVKSLRDHGHTQEADFVEVLAQWHEASDGRGLNQLQRCRYNYKMLNAILDKWMPWHKELYDFSSIDINRRVEYICGFSRETVIEIITNIESQEYRRRQILELGYPEHPRAGGTDDLETFFSMVHGYLGMVFTLKDFKHLWPKVVREFKKRMDNELPYYHWSLNERFSEELPSFDDRPNFDNDEVESNRHPLRLHRLRVNQREDSSILVAGRAFLSVRNQTTIRHRMHCPVLGPVDVPDSTP